MTDPAALKTTALHDAHAALGAKLVPFSGWEMPVQYAGVKEEHLAVRKGCGVFDVSHMGQIECSGSQAFEFLQHQLSNDISKLQIGGAQYSCLCAPDGGIIDDLFTYQLANHRYLTVTNAANHQQDLGHFTHEATPFDVEVIDRAPAYAMLAVQGPNAREIVGELTSSELPGRFRTADLEVGGVGALVCGTGYTGEDGVEILCPPADVEEVWKALVAAGATPCGLAARDTLRLEVCFHLHGNDIGPERNPIEAGLGWCCAEETGFIGSEAVARARADDTEEKLAAFTIEGKGIPRAGNPLLSGEQVVGAVTSGTFSPSLEVGIGMGYVRSRLAEPGTELVVDVRGKQREVVVRAKPLHEAGS